MPLAIFRSSAYAGSKELCHRSLQNGNFNPFGGLARRSILVKISKRSVNIAAQNTYSPKVGGLFGDRGFTQCRFFSSSPISYDKVKQRELSGSFTGEKQTNPMKMTKNDLSQTDKPNVEEFGKSEKSRQSSEINLSARIVRPRGLTIPVKVKEVTRLFSLIKQETWPLSGIPIQLL